MYQTKVNIKDLLIIMKKAVDVEMVCVMKEVILHRLNSRLAIYTVIKMKPFYNSYFNVNFDEIIAYNKNKVYNLNKWEVDVMSITLLDLTERLVPISDFSQGKAGKIFNDVAENNNEYIILKNNQPTAVLLSVKEYREIQEKSARLEELLEKIENIRLLKLAESRADNNTYSFESFVNEQGFSMEELEEVSESVEFE